MRDLDLVDYPNVMRLKRSVLEWCVNAFLQCATPERKAAFDAYLVHRPEVSDYALFRATVEKYKASWHSWPIELHLGKLNDALVNPLATHYFLLSQWWAEEQINSVATKSLDLGAKGLYLDLPLGVNADSYDVYRHREIFALGASGGAPPDSFFTLGQDWGFPPIRPDKLLDDKLVYLRSCLKRHMKHCSMLRVDHVMGIHRLYWVPKGLGAKNGAYVRYNSDAMYAIYNLESYRNKTLIAGEDLGTVPPAVRPAMKKHGWHRLFVGQFEMNPVEGCVLNKAPEGAIASLNTHDLPPFAAFWTGTDIDDRVEMGLLTKEEAKAEKSVREALFVRVLEAISLQTGHSFEAKLEQEQIAEVLACLYREMMQSQAGTVLANLEDFWFTKNPQNVPGTWKEKPNWRHKASYSVVDLLSVGCIEKILGKIKR